MISILDAVIHPLEVVTTFDPVYVSAAWRTPSHVPDAVTIFRFCVGISTLTLVALLTRMIFPLAELPVNMTPVEDALFT